MSEPAMKLDLGKTVIEIGDLDTLPSKVAVSIKPILRRIQEAIDSGMTAVTHRVLDTVSPDQDDLYLQVVKFLKEQGFDVRLFSKPNPQYNPRDPRELEHQYRLEISWAFFTA